MKRTIIVVMVSMFLVTGCTIGFLGNHPGGSLVVVPALPLIVELDADNYYYQNGYYYSHRGNVWLYSESKQGPWFRLPRSHYPRQVHYRGQNDRDRDHRDRGHDRHDR